MTVFSFQGRLRRLPYIGATLLVFASEYAVAVVTFVALKLPLTLSWRLYAIPLSSLAQLENVPGVFLGFALLLSLIAAWIIASLSFRRAADANAPAWLAAASIAPVVQIPVVVLLWLLPSKNVEAAGHTGDRRSEAKAAVYGVVAGVALTLAAVAAGALIFGTYGFGMFVLSPFVVGVLTGYFANRSGDIGVGRTVRTVGLALALGGAGLVVFALEGIVCIAMAAPLAFGVAAVGGMVGRAAAGSRRSASQSVMSIALIPLAFATEKALPATTAFETHESIEIAAPADAVWSSLVHMDRIDERPALPFRLGMAYPLGARFVGSGVGATRLGYFSTGIAVERVTEWKPGRKLTFVVLSDPPAMRELSPYAHVHAPHVHGYFITTLTSFELVPLPGGRARVLETTKHQLKLDPVLYWMPMAREIIHLNNARVLAHLKNSSERARTSPG